MAEKKQKPLISLGFSKHVLQGGQWFPASSSKTEEENGSKVKCNFFEKCFKVNKDLKCMSHGTTMILKNRKEFLQKKKGRPLD